jgi:hypothetical protein
VYDREEEKRIKLKKPPVKPTDPEEIKEKQEEVRTKFEELERGRHMTIRQKVNTEKSAY